MAKQRFQSEVDANDDAPRKSRSTADANRRPGGWRMFWLGSRLFVVAALVGALGFFAPQLIGSTGLWKSLLASAVPAITPYIDAKSLQLSWLAPIEIQGLAIRDPAG